MPSQEVAARERVALAAGCPFLSLWGRLSGFPQRALTTLALSTLPGALFTVQAHRINSRLLQPKAWHLPTPKPDFILEPLINLAFKHLEADQKDHSDVVALIEASKPLATFLVLGLFGSKRQELEHFESALSKFHKQLYAFDVSAPDRVPDHIRTTFEGITQSA